MSWTGRIQDPTIERNERGQVMSTAESSRNEGGGASSSASPFSDIESALE